MSIDPKILKRMQGEDAYLQSQSRGSRRVKLERGQNWIVRFLPARMGPDNLWFARIAKHWLNKLPIVCPHNTAEDFGGDPDFACPVCAVCDELNDSPDEIISKLGFKTKANAQFLTYCIVWEKDGIEQPMSEIMNPYEFWHYRSTFEELKGFYLGGGKKSADSVLDYECGNDFSVNRTGKGLRLDKLDSSPIFNPKDPKYPDWIKKLESQMKTPKVTIPTDQQLQLFAQKLHAAAARGGYAEDDDTPRRGRGVRGGYGDDDESQFRRGSRRQAEPEEPEDDLPYDDAPPARPAARAAAPARRSAPEPDGDDAPAPRRRTAPVDDPPARRREEPAGQDEPAPRRRSAPADEEPPRRRQAEPEDEPPRRSSARRPANEEPPEDAGDPPDDGTDREPEPETPAPRRGLEPTARRAREAASAPQSEAEDEDNLPEDDRDPVPPAKAEAEAGDDAPTPVSRRGSQGKDINARLAKLGRNA